MIGTNFLVRTSKILVSRNCNKLHRRGFSQQNKKFKATNKPKNELIPVTTENKNVTITAEAFKKRVENIENLLVESKSIELIKQQQLPQLLKLVQQNIFKQKSRLDNKLKKWKVGDKIGAIVKVRKERIKVLMKPENLKELATTTRKQWKTLQASEGYANVKKIPRKTLEISKSSANQIQHYWTSFSKSPYKDQIVSIIKAAIVYGSKGIAGLLKFIKDVYNAPVGKK